MEELGLDEKIKRYDVLECWAEVVGDRIAGVSKAEFMTQDGKLVVRVSQAPWRNELLFLKKELIAKINSRMKREIVNDIVFR